MVFHVVNKHECLITYYSIIHHLHQLREQDEEGSDQLSPGIWTLNPGIPGDPEMIRETSLESGPQDDLTGPAMAKPCHFQGANLQRTLRSWDPGPDGLQIIVPPHILGVVYRYTL